MSLSFQRSVVESFKFNDRNRRAVHVNGEDCLISQDLYTAVGYVKENGAKTIQRIVPEKYNMRLGDAVIDMKEVEENIDMVLLKEPGFYCFL